MGAGRGVLCRSSCPAPHRRPPWGAGWRTSWGARDFAGREGNPREGQGRAVGGQREGLPLLPRARRRPHGGHGAGPAVPTLRAPMGRRGGLRTPGTVSWPGGRGRRAGSKRPLFWGCPWPAAPSRAPVLRAPGPPGDMCWAQLGPAAHTCRPPRGTAAPRPPPPQAPRGREARAGVGSRVPRTPLLPTACGPGPESAPGGAGKGALLPEGSPVLGQRAGWAAEGRTPHRTAGHSGGNVPTSECPHL